MVVFKYITFVFLSNIQYNLTNIQYALLILSSSSSYFILYLLITSKPETQEPNSNDERCMHKLRT